MQEFIRYAQKLVLEDPQLKDLPLDTPKTLSRFLETHNLPGTLIFVESVLPLCPENQVLLYLQALCFMDSKEFAQSDQLIRKALQLELTHNAGQRKDDFMALFRKVHEQRVITEKLAQRSQNMTRNQSGQFVPSDLTLNESDFEKRQLAIERGIPSILSISTARAASSNIGKLLSKLSGSPNVYVDAQPTPIEHDMSAGMLRDFARGGAVSYVHSRANQRNLSALRKAGIDKFLVHVRDPRQSMISNYFRSHVEQGNDPYQKQGNWRYRRYYYDDLPLEYEDMSFEEHMDWHIENVYQYYWADWIQEWLDVSNTSEFDIKFVTFDQFKREPLNYFHEIGAFYGLDWSSYTEDDLFFVKPDPPTPVNNWSSKAPLDTWREKLTDAQLEKLQALTPQALLDRFGWKR